jgi:hypothetical protein
VEKLGKLSWLRRRGAAAAAASIYIYFPYNILYYYSTSPLPLAVGPVFKRLRGGVEMKKSSPLYPTSLCTTPLLGLVTSAAFSFVSVYHGLVLQGNRVESRLRLCSGVSILRRTLSLIAPLPSVPLCRAAKAPCAHLQCRADTLSPKRWANSMAGL